MYSIKICALLFLINLASSYRLERQSDDLEINSTSIFTEEIAGLTDSNTYDSWKEWPDRLLFPKFHTSNDYKPSWTVITKSKTILPSDSFYSSTFNSPHQTSDLITSVYSSPSISSELTSTTQSPNITPTISDYFSDTSSTYLQSPLQSSFNTDDMHTTSSQDSTPTPSIDSSLFTVTTSSIPQTTPSVPLNFSEFSSDSNLFSSIDRTDDDKISSTNLDSSINPSSTLNLPETTSDGQIRTTTPLPNDDNQEYRHKKIITFNQLPQGIKNTTFEFEKKLKKIFELAYFRSKHQNLTNLDIKVHNLDWSKFNLNKILGLIYSVQVDKKYLNNEEIEKLLNQLKEDEIIKILSEPYNQSDNSPKPDIQLSELLSRKIFDVDSPYFWIMICLFLLILMICCFYLSALVCWLKHRNRSNTANFLKERKDQISPISNYSSDTLNTENFIRWRNRSESTNIKQQQLQQQQNKREKSSSSLFKNDHKTGSLNKLKKRKEIGSSPSNEFEYISFTSSDTTNSSLQRDGSLNKRTTQIRHHPYNNQDHNKNINKKDLNTSDYIDYQQDYQQDYHIPTIQKINQFNQPNSIKLLISRGVQSNLLPIDKQDDLKDNLLNNNLSSNNLIMNSKKFPLEIPSLNNSYYGNNVSVLNLSKEKLIPLTQYHTSDSSTTTTTNNTINNKNEFNNRFRLIDSQNNRPNSSNKLDNSRPDSRISEPKRLIKKEIIEELETTTTTTTFKNPIATNKSTNTLDNLNKDLQLNEQTETIIKAIRDELSKFYSKPK